MLNRLYGVLLLTLLILALVSSCENNHAQAVDTLAPVQPVAAETTTLPNTI